jgi:RNA polymerase sigma factor (sigma-70 family)
MNWEQLTDAELIEAIKTGSDQALAGLMLKHNGRTSSYVRRILTKEYNIKDENMVDDIMQQTWIAVHCSIIAGGYKEQNAFERWINTIARNLVYAEVKKRAREQVKELPENFNVVDERTLSPDLSLAKQEQEVLEGQRSIVVMKAFDELPGKFKEILKYRFLHKLSPKEIEKKTGVEVKTCYKIIENGKKRLTRRVARLMRSSIQSSV